MSEGKRLRCSRCGHEWMYRGKSEYFATCPRCHKNVKVDPIDKT